MEEILSIDEIEHDLEIWVSDGENFKSTSKSSLSLCLTKIRPIQSDENLIFVSEGPITDQNIKEEFGEQGSKTGNWKIAQNLTVEDFDEILDINDAAVDLKQKIHESNGKFSSDSSFLRLGDEILYPDLLIKG